MDLLRMGVSIEHSVLKNLLDVEVERLRVCGGPDYITGTGGRDHVEK